MDVDFFILIKVKKSKWTEFVIGSIVILMRILLFIKELTENYVIIDENTLGSCNSYTEGLICFKIIAEHNYVVRNISSLLQDSLLSDLIEECIVVRYNRAKNEIIEYSNNKIYKICSFQNNILEHNSLTGSSSIYESVIRSYDIIHEFQTNERRQFSVLRKKGLDISCERLDLSLPPLDYLKNLIRDKIKKYDINLQNVILSDFIMFSLEELIKTNSDALKKNIGKDDKSYISKLIRSILIL